MTPDPRIEHWNFNLYRDPVILLSTLIFILALALVLIYPGWLSYAGLGITVLLLGVVIYFFRDPIREVVDQPGLVVGPCDGKVVSIERMVEPTYLQAETLRISVFLSLFDVHVQRIPIEGRVEMVDHQPGEFLQAFRPEASEVNEFIAMQLATPYGKLLVKQIAGILARRCLNYARPDDRVRTGQRFGHIKFGSRVDLFLPPHADLTIEIGQKIIGGITPIAQFRVEDHGEK